MVQSRPVEVWRLGEPNGAPRNYQVLGDPQISVVQGRSGMHFNGRNDALVLDGNPLAGASAFVIEAQFLPMTGGQKEQRFVHVQGPGEMRILLELRLVTDTTWTFDTYVHCPDENATLFEPNRVHPLDRWYEVALVCRNGYIAHFVNGTEEHRLPLRYVPMENGRVSVGARINQVSWFKGAICQIRFEAMPPCQVAGRDQNPWKSEKTNKP